MAGRSVSGVRAAPPSANLGPVVKPIGGSVNRGTLVLAASTVLLATSATAGEAQLQALATDAVRILQEYVRVDTTNPPGNETRGVELVAGRLESADSGAFKGE